MLMSRDYKIEDERQTLEFESARPICDFAAVREL